MAATGKKIPCIGQRNRTMKRIKKFVVIGPESTGKSTLCRELAVHYNTLWSKEFAREYLQTNGNEYTYDDLLLIAKGQLALEDSAVRELSPKKNLLFVDTAMYVMKVWSEYVYGKTHRFILDTIAEREYDGYFLCYPDLPWEADPLREYPDEKIRKELFEYYFEIMTSQSVPWCEITGIGEERTQKAIAFVENIINPDSR